MGNSLLPATSDYGCGWCNKDRSAWDYSCALLELRFGIVRAESSIKEFVYKGSMDVWENVQAFTRNRGYEAMKEHLEAPGDRRP